MTKTVSSECYSISDIDYDSITSTFAKLRAVISQEASLRKELDKLLAKRTEDAHIAVQSAQTHLELVKTQEVHMREILKTESAAANEVHDSASNTSPESTAGRKQVAKRERLQEAAMIAAAEERRKADAEELHLKQEESTRLAMLEEDILAALEEERLAKEEDDRLIAQEATAIEAYHQAEAEQMWLEEERLAKEAERIVSKIAASRAVQEAATVTTIKAWQAAEAKERQLEEAKIAAREEVERLIQEREIVEEFERLEKERRVEEELLEQALMEAEMHHLAQEAALKFDDELEAQRLAGIEQRRADEERERKAQENVEEDKGMRVRKSKMKREKEVTVWLEKRNKLEKEENERLEWLEEKRLSERRRLGQQEEEREYRAYMLLKEKTTEAEKSLAMMDSQLAKLEVQRNVVLRQVESARSEEASCCYQELVRGR